MSEQLNQVAYSRNVGGILGIPLAGIGVPVQVTFDIPEDSDFLVSKISGTSTGPYDISINNPVLNRRYSNLPIRNSCYVGTALFPNKLPVSMVWHRGSSIQIDLTDQSGLANNVWLTFTGTRRYSPEIKAESISQIPMVYNALPNAIPIIIAPAGIINAPLIRYNSGKFQLCKIVGDSTGNFVYFWTVDGGNPDYNRITEPMHAAGSVGTAGNPYILDRPMDCLPRTTDNFTIVNVAVGFNTINCLSFHGKETIAFI